MEKYPRDPNGERAPNCGWQSSGCACWLCAATSIKSKSDKLNYNRLIKRATFDWNAPLAFGDKWVSRELPRCDQVQSAWKRYKEFAANHPDRIVMFCGRATVLARSGRRISSAAA